MAERLEWMTSRGGEDVREDCLIAMLVYGGDVDVKGGGRMHSGPS